MSRKATLLEARTVRMGAALTERFEAHVRRVALRAGVPVSPGDVHRALLEAALAAEEAAAERQAATS